MSFKQCSELCLKELRDEIKILKKEQDTCDTRHISGQGRLDLINNKLGGIKQTVEAVDCIVISDGINDKRYKIWQEIKQSLSTFSKKKKEHIRKEMALTI
jgi:acetate kinase